MLNIGLYGSNGHQIWDKLSDSRIALVAVSCLSAEEPLPSVALNPGVIRYQSLEELLKDDRIDLISLCSPRRRDQATDAIACLRTGKHVYAEKPAAMTESELDAILDVARSVGKEFREMAQTSFDEPYASMRELLKQNFLGDIVQIFVQKSYPMHPNRPQDEDIDGGLICQNGIHALRFVEHTAMTRINEISAIQTRNGNPVNGGGLYVAASMVMHLEGGGVASAVVNYLNPRGFGIWGNECVRIFGTEGMMETVDGGTRSRIIIGDDDRGPIPYLGVGLDYFLAYVDSILGGPPMPLSSDDELHPLRMAIRARIGAIERQS